MASFLAAPPCRLPGCGADNCLPGALQPCRALPTPGSNFRCREHWARAHDPSCNSGRRLRGPGSGVWSPGSLPAETVPERGQMSHQSPTLQGGWAPHRVQSYLSRRHLPHQAFTGSYLSLKTSWLCNRSDQPPRPLANRPDQPEGTPVWTLPPQDTGWPAQDWQGLLTETLLPRAGEEAREGGRLPRRHPPHQAPPKAPVRCAGDSGNTF